MGWASVVCRVIVVKSGQRSLMRDRPGLQALVAQVAPHLLRKRKQDALQLLHVAHVLSERRLAADGFGFMLGLDLVAVRGRAPCAASRAPSRRNACCSVVQRRVLQIANRVNAQRLQVGRALFAHAPQLEMGNGARNRLRRRRAPAAIHPACPRSRRSWRRACCWRCRWCRAGQSLCDAALDVSSPAPARRPTLAAQSVASRKTSSTETCSIGQPYSRTMRHHAVRIVGIDIEMRRGEDGLRAQPERLRHGHGRVDAERAGGIRARRDDAALFRPPADEQRQAAPLGVEQLFDRGVKGIQVEAQDDARSGHA